MPDTDSPGPSSSSGPSSSGPAPSGPAPSGSGDPNTGITRNLPVPVPPARVAAHANGEGWFARALRALFGWKPDSFRSDLRSVLEGGAAEIGLAELVLAEPFESLSDRARGAGQAATADAGDVASPAMPRPRQG